MVLLGFENCLCDYWRYVMKFLQKKTVLFLLTMTFCFMSAISVQAASKVPKLTSSKYVFPLLEDETFKIEIKNTKYSIMDRLYIERDIQNIEISDPDLASIEADIYDEHEPTSPDDYNYTSSAALVISPKKTGTAKVTFDVVYGQNGSKTKHLSFKLSIVKYKNPVSKFLIGGKNYASGFKDLHGQNVILHKDEKKVVSVRGKAGWKVVSIESRSYTGKSQKFKNNSKINLSLNISLVVTMQNKKTKCLEELVVMFNG